MKAKEWALHNTLRPTYRSHGISAWVDDSGRIQVTQIMGVQPGEKEWRGLADWIYGVTDEG